MERAIDIRRADQRFHTKLDWLDSHHCFSFGDHWDPANTHHGLLVVSNDDRILPSTGFGRHAHQDMEIVTWVLEGQLGHWDSAGNQGVIVPGLAQRMSAGRGIVHSEMNPSADEPCHFLQMWVLPDREGLEPGYEQRDVTAALARGGLVAIASGKGHEGAVRLNQASAVLWIGRLTPGETVQVPDAPHVHVYLARGSADLQEAGALATGDAARLAGAGRLTLTARDAAEVVIWETA